MSELSIYPEYFRDYVIIRCKGIINSRTTFVLENVLNGLKNEYKKLILNLSDVAIDGKRFLDMFSFFMVNYYEEERLLVFANPQFQVLTGMREKGLDRLAFITDSIDEAKSIVLEENFGFVIKYEDKISVLSFCRNYPIIHLENFNKELMNKISGSTDTVLDFTYTSGFYNWQPIFKGVRQGSVKKEHVFLLKPKYISFSPENEAIIRHFHIINSIDEIKKSKISKKNEKN